LRFLKQLRGARAQHLIHRQFYAALRILHFSLHILATEKSGALAWPKKASFTSRLSGNRTTNDKACVSARGAACLGSKSEL
jgi:hypothetical protein